MARTKSIQTINAEIEKTESELVKLQERAAELAEQLKDLRKQKRDIESKQIMDAFERSGKSLQELMIFLEV